MVAPVLVKLGLKPKAKRVVRSRKPAAAKQAAKQAAKRAPARKAVAKRTVRKRQA